MIREKDIYRSAKLMIDRRGDDAPLFAAMRADELLAKGDIEGQSAWKRILRAIDELQRGRKLHEGVQ